MPRPPSRDRQLLDPLAAFQMVHIMEGVVQRGTATVLRDLDRPMFGKTGTTSGPTNVWFVGGTPDVVGGVYLGYDQPRNMGGYAQGGRIAAPIFKDWARTALKDQPKIPFVAPQGIRWARVDRATGRIVYGSFPTREDAKAAVIWEAFQPQTEPRRAFRRSRILGLPGQEDEASEGEASRTRAQARERTASPRARPATQPAPEAAQATLQNQAGIY
jgi:penicillin-binding protein 1A